jgi:RNA polymerase sigma-70 factor (ECF subfamily)
MAALSDAQLTAHALGPAGPARQTACRLLLDRHRASVFRIARGQTGDADAALDITQQTFIAAFAALHRYDPARPLAHWLARIAINKCHDHARRQTVRRWLNLPLPAHVTPADPAPPADQSLSDRQELSRAMAGIAALPARLRDVLVLCGIEGMAQAEAAALLAITPKAVETRLRRAREKLRDGLRD